MFLLTIDITHKFVRNCLYMINYIHVLLLVYFASHFAKWKNLLFI